MDDGGLTDALERAERALKRIEYAVANQAKSAGGDDALRAKVREAVAELDQLIREASN
jgi:hypothetical protein